MSATKAKARSNGKATPIRETGVFVSDSGNKNFVHPLLIGTPTRGPIQMGWSLAMRSLAIPANWSAGYFSSFIPDTCVPFRYTVAHAQNIIVKHFLEARENYEFLLLLEDDTIPPPDLFILLDEYLRNGPPIVSGLYFQKSFPIEPLIYRGRGNGAFRDFKLGQKVWADGVPTGCHPPETKIKTPTGWLNIADVEVGDEVVTHTGEAAAVNATMRREYSGEMITVIPKKLGYPVRLTPEHPVLAVEAKRYGVGIRKPTSAFRRFEYGEPEWIEAGSLTEDHILLYRIDERLKDVESLRLSRSLANLVLDGDRVCYPNQNGHQSNWLLNEIPVDERLMRLIGYYLADGDAQDAAVRFAFAPDEERYVEDVCGIVRDLFGLDNASVCMGSCLRVRFGSKVLAQWFQRECGRSNEKHVPDWALHLPVAKQEQLLLGYLRGDGHYRTTTDGITSNSVSWTLTMQLREIYLRCGLIPSVKRGRRSGGYAQGGHRYSMSILGEPARAFLERLEPDRVSGWERRKAQGGQAWIDRGCVWMPIREITREEYDGYVYNFQVGGQIADPAATKELALQVVGEGSEAGRFFEWGMTVPAERPRDWGSQNGDETMGGSFVTGGFVVHNCLLIHRPILEIMYAESREYIFEGEKLREVFVDPRQIIVDPDSGMYGIRTGTSDLEWCSRVIREQVIKRAGWPKIARKRFPLLVDTRIACQHISPDGTRWPP